MILEDVVRVCWRANVMFFNLDLARERTGAKEQKRWLERVCNKMSDAILVSLSLCCSISHKRCSLFPGSAHLKSLFVLSGLLN